MEAIHLIYVVNKHIAEPLSADCGFSLTKYSVSVPTPQRLFPFGPLVEVE